MMARLTMKVRIIFFLLSVSVDMKDECKLFIGVQFVMFASILKLYFKVKLFGVLAY